MRFHSKVKITINRYRKFKKAVSNLGTFNTLAYIFKTKVLNYFRPTDSVGNYRIGVLSSNELIYPLKFRYNSSDISVFSGTFVKNAYESIKIDHQPKLIIDCGANVGYSSAYFLSKYPSVKVLAIEPDIRNFKILKENLRPYDNRAECILSGVWSHKTKLKVEIGEVGEWKEWTTKVRECTEKETPDLNAIDIITLLNESNFNHIDILKIDIEGAEANVFAENYDSWLNKVNIIAIEIHGEQCEEIFYKALSNGNYQFRRAGELTIAQRLTK